MKISIETEALSTLVGFRDHKLFDNAPLPSTALRLACWCLANMSDLNLIDLKDPSIEETIYKNADGDPDADIVRLVEADFLWFLGKDNLAMVNPFWVRQEGDNPHYQYLLGSLKTLRRSQPPQSASPEPASGLADSLAPLENAKAAIVPFS